MKDSGSGNTGETARLHGLSPLASRLLVAAGPWLERGDPGSAREALEGALALAPAHPEVLRLTAVARVLEGRAHEAVDLLREALASRPRDALLHNNLGSALRACGDADAALAAFARACELAPDLAAAWFNLGKSRKALAHSATAQAALERALVLAPDHVAAWIVSGDNLKALGRVDEAVAAYRTALRLQPQSALAWWGLANLKTVRLDAGDSAALEHLIANPGLAHADRALAGFALAKALQDQGRYPAAWATLETANALRREQQPWDSASFSRHVAEIAAAFAHAPSDCASTRGREIVFIVSLPRSGSTLVEQIIGSHPRVHGGGELPDLAIVLDEESRRRGIAFPGWVADTGPGDWERLGLRYLERTSALRAHKPCSSDKALDNWLYLGAAAMMLPGACFVHCRREPIETALSCYRQWFNTGQAFSYDLDALASCLHDHDRLMALWQRQWPQRVCSQSLEALQADPEPAVRRLLEFAGLAFDAVCLDFANNERSVHTASAAQVRAPLQRSTRRAPDYGDLLDGLRRRLATP